MADALPEMTEEDKAKELERKIRAPFVWGEDKRGVRVEDLQENRFDEALEIIKEHYFTTEVTYKMLNFLEDEESMEDFMMNVKNQMKDKISIVAIKNKTDEIVGVLTQRIADKATFSRTFSRSKIISGDKYSTLMSYYRKLEESFNAHDKYNTDRYLKISTMVLLPKYRDKGLEKLMLKCAMRTGRSCKITAIIGIFALGTVQTFATQVGFEKINTIFYGKYSDENGKKVFYDPGFGNFGAMLMGRQIPEEEEEEK